MRMHVDDRIEVLISVPPSLLQRVCFPITAPFPCLQASLWLCQQLQKLWAHEVTVSPGFESSCAMLSRGGGMETILKDINSRKSLDLAQKGMEDPLETEEGERILDISKEGRILGSARSELPR